MRALLLPLANADYKQYKFPPPQYLGAKFIHREWIEGFIPGEVKCILDAFSGSQSTAYLFKQLGKKVITNDFMRFNFMIGKALIENKNDILESDDLNMLFSENSNPDKYNLIETLYTDLFFNREDARFADKVRSNISNLSNIYKQALALAIMCRSMTRKVTMGHLAHTCALEYASNPKRVKRNRSLARPLKDIYLDLLHEYNEAVFDNGMDNLSYNENINDILPLLHNVDAVYFDPPYCNSHADYQSFYHLLETYTEYWKDKKFINKIRRYEPKRYSGFDKKCDAIINLDLMFQKASYIPLWLISYNDRSYPDIRTFIEIIKKYRKVELAQKKYAFSMGGKGSVAGSNEILLICKQK